MSEAVLAIEQLSGVGTHLANSLRTHFRTEAEFLAAAGAGDLERIAAVPGVSPRRAAELVRQVRGVAEDKFLATTQARRLHDEILEALCRFAATSTGRNRLKLLAPQPDAATAKKHVAAVMAHKATAAALDRSEVHRLLRKIRLPAEPAPKQEGGRLLVASQEVQDRLHRAGVHRWVAIAGLAELAQASDYELVLILDEAEAPGIENAVEMSVDASAQDVAPESVLAWFSCNRGAIEAADALAALLNRPQRARDALQLLDLVPPSGPIPDLMKEAHSLQAVLKSELRSRVAGLSVSGTELLESIGRKLPAGLQRAVEETLRHGKDLMRERTGVAVQAFSNDPSLDVDEDELQRLGAALRSQSSIQVYQARVAAARQLAPLRAVVTAELEYWLAFDADFALGCFALHYDLHPARFGDGLAFSSSIHLSLADQPAAQRIAYRLGGKEKRVALLTGANSGGKTTLLEHLAQLAIMARLGLPVVGEDVEVPWFAEVHVVTARRSLDAGAFEAFLKSFLPVVLGSERRLVLADEVESVTELEAAGRILGFFLDRLNASQSLALVVTHLAPQILARTATPPRIDGIEATGLDDRNRLLVDRTPRMGVLARSTPELIVQRLAATARGPEKALYADLLAAFTHGNGPATAATRPGKGKRAACVSPPS